MVTTELPPAVSSSATPQAVLPAAVTAVINAWKGYRLAVADFNTRIHDLQVQEKLERGFKPTNPADAADDTPRTSIVMSASNLDEDVARVAKSALSVLTRTAEQQFAPSGTVLSIPEPTFNGKPRPEDRWARGADEADFDPEGVWAFLAANYGGDAGKKKAYTDIAKKLGTALGMYREPDFKTVGGRVILSVTTYPERRFDAKEIIGYQDSTRLNEVLTGFESVGEWSGLWSETDAIHVKWARSDIELSRRDKVMPERRMIGEAVLIVPFRSKWEYRLSAAFAEQLNLFFAEYYFPNK